MKPIAAAPAAICRFLGLVAAAPAAAAVMVLISVLILMVLPAVLQVGI